MCKKTFFLIGLCLAMTLQAVAGTYPNTAAPPAAQDGGEALTVAGLQDEVQVHFTENDIPHIYASNEHDLFFAQGYITAEYRWWQMEWSRKQARGELASLMGPSRVGGDTFLRTLGLAHAAEADLEVVSPEFVAAAQAYADGVNAWLADKNPAEAAIEYTYLEAVGGAAPESLTPWTVLDTMVFAKAVSMNFAQGSLENELLKGGLIDAGGPFAALLLAPGYNYEKGPLVSEPGRERLPLIENQPAIPPTSANAVTYSGIEAITGLPRPVGELWGSNSWVISGELTDTGAPYLANDPHIGQNVPSVWIQIGLHCTEISEACNWDAYGYIFPGAPGILIGHNARIAWGMTVNGLDYIDIYKLEVNPDNPNQYLYEGEWLDMDVRTETIEVAGSDPVEIPVQNTRFGPIFNHLVSMETPMAARAVILDPTGGVEMVYRLPQAGNWEEFQAAVALFDTAGQNIIYGDVDGNIGVVAAGKIPIRPVGDDGTVPRLGVDASTEWQGYIPMQDNPRLYNPESGFIVAANNAFLRPEDFPETIFGYYFDYGWRASRVEQMILESDVMTLDRMAEIQTDDFNPNGAILVPYILETDFGDDEANAARDFLVDWDYMNDADSAQAALFNAFWLKLMPLVFDELDAAGGVSGRTRETFIINGMVGASHPIWANAELGTNDPIVIVAMALKEGWAFAAETLGDDPNAWRWDGLHISSARHNPLGRLDESVADAALLEELNSLFNRPIGVSGGTDSVNNQGWDIRNGTLELGGAIVSMRMIVDFANMDNSRFVHELGQSGDPTSPHYNDLHALWATGGYIQPGFTPAGVEAATVRTLTLAP